MKHADGCPAAHNPRHGCTCRGWLPVEIAGGTTQTSTPESPRNLAPVDPARPTSVAPAGEDHGAPIRQYGARGPLSDPPSLGEYVVVTYADHLAALAVAEKKGYHVGYKSAAGEFLTPESLAVTGMDDPRYAKGFADAQDKVTEWLRDPEHHPSDEAKAWAWAYAEAIERLLRVDQGDSDE